MSSLIAKSILFENRVLVIIGAMIHWSTGRIQQHDDEVHVASPRRESNEGRAVRVKRADGPALDVNIALLVVKFVCNINGVMLKTIDDFNSGDISKEILDFSFEREVSDEIWKSGGRELARFLFTAPDMIVERMQTLLQVTDDVVCKENIDSAPPESLIVWSLIIIPINMSPQLIIVVLK